jgi:glutaredoxin
MGAQFSVVELDRGGHGVALQYELSKLSGTHTTPQLFINRHYVGGCSDVVELKRAGKLKEMLLPFCRPRRASCDEADELSHAELDTASSSSSDSSIDGTADGSSDATEAAATTAGDQSHRKQHHHHHVHTHEHVHSEHSRSRSSSCSSSSSATDSTQQQQHSLKNRVPVSAHSTSTSSMRSSNSSSSSSQAQLSDEPSLRGSCNHSSSFDAAAHSSSSRSSSDSIAICTVTPVGPTR